MKTTRSFSIPTHRRALLAACAASALLAACGGGSDDLDDRTNTAEPQLRFVNAAPTAPSSLSLVITRNGSTVADAPSTGLGYKGFSNYHDITNNVATTFTIRSTTPAADLASVNANPQRGRKYTVVAVPNGLGIEALLIDDPYNKPIGNDQSRIRVVNASSNVAGGSPNAASLDVYVTPQGADLASRIPEFGAVAPRAALPTSDQNSRSFADTTTTYQVRVTPAGSKTVIFNTTLQVNKNDDLLFITVPSDTVPVPNQIKLLVVKSDDADRTADEPPNTP